MGNIAFVLMGSLVYNVKKKKAHIIEYVGQEFALMTVFVRRE